MPKYSFECPVHGEFEITVPISQHQDHPLCPVLISTERSSGGLLQCGEVTIQTYTPSRSKDYSIKPVIIHVGKDGALRFPAHENARVPKGFEKVELRTLRELEVFEKKANQRLSAEASRDIENEERHFAAVHAKNRSDLRQRMQSMSPLGRDFARLVMKINDARKRKSSDVGFNLQILNQDSSNREPYRDERTGWKPVRWI